MQVLCPVIVGRADEQHALTELVAEATSGSGGVAFLVGEAGVGKTRLARVAFDAGRARNAVVLSTFVIGQLSMPPGARWWPAMTEAHTLVA